MSYAQTYEELTSEQLSQRYQLELRRLRELDQEEARVRMRVLAIEKELKSRGLN